MAKPRRKGAETSETRARLLDVTERIMLADGYAAVSSRRVAKDADVTAALVHYYFGTIDELLLAVLHRGADRQLDRQVALLETSSRPLHALWDSITDPTRTGLVLEFMAMANHRKVIRAELGTHAEQFRKAQIEVLRERLDTDQLERNGLDVESVLVLINAVATNLVLERSIGHSLGHEEAVAVVQRELDRLEGHLRHDG